MTNAGFCPHCGAPRSDWAKFCGSCGRAYDAPPTPVTAPTAPPPAPDETYKLSGSGMPASRRGLLILLGIAVLVGGYYILNNRIPSIGPSSGPSSSNLPPAGDIWFGQTFDSTTFEVRSRLTSATAGQTIALVGHLSRSTDASNANLRISLDGTTFVNQALGLTGETDVYGATYVPPVAGAYRFELTDVGGSVLAAGSITVR
jgi:hypothetical protein